MGVNFMSDTLYIQTEENVEVHHPHVYLQDIAKLSCTNSKILNHLRVLPVANLDPDKTGRYVISVMDLINDIQLKEPDLDITHIGEPNFIITYQKEGTVNIVIRWCKVIFVCLATFFGAGFSIMTFNNDVDIPALFEQIYTQVTGQPTTGNTVLEISYSLGIGLGVLFFFNHFGRMKLTNDPTPMQVQMRLVKRLSDSEDRIPVMVSERLVDVTQDYVGQYVEIHGQFRSYNRHEEKHNRLVLSAFARELKFLEEEDSLAPVNQIFLDGYICKPPVYRKTPLGREIADLLLAVNRPYGKSDYIPCICWGRNARYASAFEVGGHVLIWGRIQSREYMKRIGENETQKRIAYEVSVSKLEYV